MKKEWMKILPEKKHIAALLVSLMLCLSPGFDGISYGAQTDDYVKVGLKYGSSAVNSCTLTSDTGFQIVDSSGSRLEETLPISAYTSITASVENGEVVLRDTDSGAVVSASLGRDDCIMPMDYLDDGTVKLDGVAYRDGFQLLVSSGNKLTVINYVSMDHYLYGVLPGEMGTGFPMEALKAQAVAARSYTEVNLSTHLSSGFQVCGTTHCQMYKAYAGENPRTNQAVDETSGLVLYSDGKPAAGYYYKNSGGYTQNSEDVWSGKVSYLRAVEDIYSPDYPWTATLSMDELGARLANSGYNVGAVHSVEIAGRNVSGAVSKLTIAGSNDTVTLTKEKIRTVIGGSVLKSTMFDISDGTAPAAAAQSSTVYVRDYSGASAAGSSVYVQSASGASGAKQTGDLYVWTGSSAQKLITGSDASEGAVSGNTVTFTGKGYGHGVGMAQDSAMQMAQQGMDFEEILKFFYTDVTIE